MAFKISHSDLQTISNCLTSIKDDKFTESLNNFLKEKKDDYYFYGRESIDALNLEITISQIGRIVSYVDSSQYSFIHGILNSIYLSALGSFQKSVFLYGRNRV